MQTVEEIFSDSLFVVLSFQVMFVYIYICRHYVILIKLENISDEMKIIYRLFR